MTMPTSRRQDDDEPPAGPRGVPVSAAVFGMLLALFLGAIAGAGVTYLTAVRQAQREAEQTLAAELVARQQAEAAAVAARRGEAAGAAGAERAKAAARLAPISRDEFRAKVMGKTPGQVIEAVGRPDNTSDVGGESTWFYRHRTLDPVSQLVDSLAHVVFKDGVVARVNY